MINKMLFENYKDYLLSLNIAQISREFGFKKFGKSSFYLLTNVIRRFIEKICTDTQRQVEASGRNECNLIDLLFTLLDDRKINQNDILYYINSSKIEYDFTKNHCLHKLLNSEEKERKNLIKKINISSIKIRNDEDYLNIKLDKNLIKAIPPMLRYFPPEYGVGGVEPSEGEENMKKINMINNILEENNNKKLNSGNILNERKTVEELNNTANYFDMSKKHSFHKNNLDINIVLNKISYVKDELMLGKKHERYLLDEGNNSDENKDKDDLYEGLRAKKQKLN